MLARAGARAKATRFSITAMLGWCIWRFPCGWPAKSWPALCILNKSSRGRWTNLLLLAACAMRQSVRGDDLVARIGGDEFAVLFCDAGPEPEVFRERLGRSLAAEESGSAGPLGLSVGFARFPEDGRNADALLRVADARMYADKRTEEGGVAYNETV